MAVTLRSMTHEEASRLTDADLRRMVSSPTTHPGVLRDVRALIAERSQRAAIEAAAPHAQVNFVEPPVFTGDFNLGPPGIAPSSALAPVISEVPVVQQAQDFYGFEVTRTATFSDIPPGSTLAPASIGGAIVPVSTLVGRLGGTLGQRLTAWVIGSAAGTRLLWANLPSWLRSAMALVGLSGATILVDTATEGPIQIGPFGGGGLAGRELNIQVGRYYDGRIITKTWTANGIQFWATGLTRADRMHHVLKLDGEIKSWKPPRPVVLMPGGAKNIRDLLRADDIVDKQLKKVAKALRRRTPTPRKDKKKPAEVVVVGAAPGVHI